MALSLIDDALDDLQRLSRSGNLALILKKLAQIEADPQQVGHPLGGELMTFRKLVFGNRQWRIVFRPDQSEAVVWVIGSRDDMECYELAKKRIAQFGDTAVRRSLSQAMEILDRSQPSS